MTIPSSLATTMYYNIVYEGAAKNLTPAACAPMKWSRRRNVMGVAVPAMVSRYGRSWRHPEYTPVDKVQAQSLSIPWTRARLIHLAQRAPDTSFASPEPPFQHVDNQYTGYSERQPKIEVLRTTTFVQAQKTGICDHKPRMSLRYRRISTENRPRTSAC